MLERVVKTLTDAHEPRTPAPAYRVALLFIICQHSSKVRLTESADVLPEVLNPEWSRYSALSREVHDLISECHPTCHMRHRRTVFACLARGSELKSALIANCNISSDTNSKNISD